MVFKKLSSLYQKLKTYNKITKFTLIARRYFVVNFFDGNLTVLGILLGFFTGLLTGKEESIPAILVILTGFGTSISMFISGLSGSYFSERAEQKKLKVEIEKAMASYIEEEDEEYEEDGSDMDEILAIKKAMVTLGELKKNDKILNEEGLDEEVDDHKPKTLYERAESFAGVFVATVNGLSPFLGGLVPLIPFFFIDEARYIPFLISFIIIISCIILLGVFIGIISRQSIIKNIIQMILAFALTTIIVLLFGVVYDPQEVVSGTDANAFLMLFMSF
jgi:predicted membrane protein (TIGR00267 family)